MASLNERVYSQNWRKQVDVRSVVYKVIDKEVSPAEGGKMIESLLMENFPTWKSSTKLSALVQMFSHVSQNVTFDTALHKLYDWADENRIYLRNGEM